MTSQDFEALWFFIFITVMSGLALWLSLYIPVGY